MPEGYGVHRAGDVGRTEPLLVQATQPACGEHDGATCHRAEASRPRIVQDGAADVVIGLG